MWFTEQCLNNALRLETYRTDAEKGGDTELGAVGAGSLVLDRFFSSRASTLTFQGSGQTGTPNC